MSVSTSSFNLWSAMGTLNEWMDRETRPITWHKIQLLINKIGLDLQRAAGGEVGVVDYAAANGVLNASDPAVMRVDAGGGVMNLLASPDIEKAGVKWSTLLINEGGETITVQTSAAGAIGTVATLAKHYVAWDGTAWSISIAL